MYTPAIIKKFPDSKQYIYSTHIYHSASVSIYIFFNISVCLQMPTKLPIIQVPYLRVLIKAIDCKNWSLWTTYSSLSLECQMSTKKSAILGMFNSTKDVGSMWDEWVHGCYHEVEPKFFLFHITPYFLTILAIVQSEKLLRIFLQIQMSSGMKKVLMEL